MVKNILFDKNSSYFDKKCPSEKEKIYNFAKLNIKLRTYH